MRNTIIRAPRRDRFTIIDQRILQDKRLSWAAKGLLCFLLSLPDNWKILISDLIKRGDLKRDGIYKLLRELRDVGYIEYHKSRDSQGRIRGGTYIVHEIPNTPHTDLPDTAQPDTTEPDPAKPGALTNTNKYKITTTTTEECSSGEEFISDLVFPRGLLPAERTQAERLIQTLTESNAQQVLDEWAGIIAAGAIRSSRAGCLRGLIQRAHEGTFTPERALSVAQARENQRRLEIAEEKIKAQPQQPVQINDSNPLAQRLTALAKRVQNE